MRVLVWLRSDLRIDDNRALHAACREARRGVMAAFLLSPGQWRLHDWADVKVDFLLRNLQSLSTSLARLNVPLLVRTADRFSDAPQTLRRLAVEHACDAVYFNREYEVNESRRDVAVQVTLSAVGIATRAFDDQTILPPNAVRTTDDRFYTVFTPFKRAWIERIGRGADIDPLGTPRAQPEPPAASDPIPPALEGFDRVPADPALWPPTESAARKRLDDFIATQIQHYRDKRDIPSIEATSRLSPYLTLGVISPRRCLAAARAANRGLLTDGQPGPDTWMSELIWREFYRHVLVGYPRVSMSRAFRLESESVPWRQDEEHLTAWCQGRTGYPIVDAGMRQLNAQGWMHNRVRMITAMFLSKHLLLDWRLGERYFMQRLIDGDLASNNGGWQWSASTGTDAAPYFRIFNPFAQSARFDPDGEYICTWVPELRAVPRAALHDPRRLAEALSQPTLRLAGDPSPVRKARDRTAPGKPPLKTYPPPIVEHETARARALAAFGRK